MRVGGDAAGQAAFPGVGDWPGRMAKRRAERCADGGSAANEVRAMDMVPGSPRPSRCSEVLCRRRIPAPTLMGSPEDALERTTAMANPLCVPRLILRMRGFP
jgi:hypothetical protein